MKRIAVALLPVTRGHGIFTYYFLRGMRGQQSDVNRDGYVDVDELYQYLMVVFSNTGRM